MQDRLWGCTLGKELSPHQRALCLAEPSLFLRLTPCRGTGLWLPVFLPPARLWLESFNCGFLLSAFRESQSFLCSHCTPVVTVVHWSGAGFCRGHTWPLVQRLRYPLRGSRYLISTLASFPKWLYSFHLKMAPLLQQGKGMGLPWAHSSLFSITP